MPNDKKDKASPCCDAPCPYRQAERDAAEERGRRAGLEEALARAVAFGDEHSYWPRELSDVCDELRALVNDMTTSTGEEGLT